MSAGSLTTLVHSAHFFLEIEMCIDIREGPYMKQEHFWILIPNEDVPKYCKSAKEFLYTLFRSYSSRDIKNTMRIASCQYIDNDSEGLPWLLDLRGIISFETRFKRDAIATVRWRNRIAKAMRTTPPKGGFAHHNSSFYPPTSTSNTRISRVQAVASALH